MLSRPLWRHCNILLAMVKFNANFIWCNYIFGNKSLKMCAHAKAVVACAKFCSNRLIRVWEEELKFKGHLKLEEKIVSGTDPSSSLLWHLTSLFYIALIIWWNLLGYFCTENKQFERYLWLVHRSSCRVSLYHCPAQHAAAYKTRTTKIENSLILLTHKTKQNKTKTT